MTPITAQVESIAFGGDGVLRAEGRVIFVPFTAPGDLAEIELVEEKKRFARGKLFKLIEASPLRTKPLCPYYEKCGGCQLQHIEYSSQRDAKRLMVEDTLKRIGKLPVPTVEIEEDEALSPWGYRERIALHLKHGKIGFISYDNRSLVEIELCPIFQTEMTPLFKELQSLALLFESNGRVDVLKNGKGKYLVYVRLERRDPQSKEALEWAFDNMPSLAGLEIDRVGNWGEEFVQSAINGLKIRYSPKVFIQNNRAVSEKIYKEIASLVKGSTKVLDLYSGIGITSLWLAQEGAKVVAVESNLEAVKFAKFNAQQNKIHTIDFVGGSVENKLEGLIKEHAFDAAVINPPREGLYPSVAEILKSSGIKTLIYVSCMPSTLARDVHLLKEGGYEIKKVKAFDMFPQTGHIETLLHLSLN